MDLDPDFGLRAGAAIVTGAAGGIGREIAIGLACRGAAVACLDRPGAALEAVASEIVAGGGQALACTVDVADEGALENVLAYVEARLPRVVYAVNAAGINVASPALEMTREQWEEVMRVNATGILLSCRVQARAMRRSGGGSIVNIASMSATIVNRMQHQIAYYASKAAVKHMTKSMAAEWASSNIRVNSVSPGYTATPMLTASEATLNEFRAMTPMGRLAEPREIVGPVVFLLSSASSYVTGHDLKVDGGYTVW